MKVYQVGPLFTEAKIFWHRSFTQKLKDNGHEVMWPGNFLRKKKP